MDPQPLVAIVGAPNVGKSTLFNRLVRSRKAIVTDEPGVTRDRLYGLADGVPRPFRVVDTGGLTPSSAEPFAREIENQAASALAEADVVLFVVDVRGGITAIDRDLAAWLRRRAVPTIVVANKADTPALEIVSAEAFELGLGPPVPVSAEHGGGLDTLLSEIDARLPDAQVEQIPGIPQERPIAVAIVGRPNVGKSSLLNHLLGEERAIVSDLPGTTRDAVDTLVEIHGRRFLLIDTAGLRRRGKARRTAEALSVVMAHRSIERADVVVLVLDGTQPIAAQDAHVAGFAQDAAKPIVVVVNKWDLVTSREETAKAWDAGIRRRLKFVKQVPVLLVSARTGQRVGRILERCHEVHESGGQRVPTAELNRWLAEVAAAERSAPARGRSLRLLYATQVGVHPPRFVLFCNDARGVHFSLRRHLENSLREKFAFGAAPIRLTFRSRRRRERS